MRSQPISPHSAVQGQGTRSDGLEISCPFRGTGGSNPSLSAISYFYLYELERKISQPRVSDTDSQVNDEVAG